MEDDFVAIIGLGLIGGSLARDLAARGARVSAYDADPAALERAMAAGIVHRAMDATLEGVRDAATIVIAVPVDAAIGVLERIAPLVSTTALITDVGSTKSRIVAAASRLGLTGRFVGAHPLAGDHRSGWEASRVDLFRGARVYLCPMDDTNASLLDRAARFWSGVGAEPVVTGADPHDRKLAYTSHLPHLVSIGLSLALAENGIARGELGRGGLDMTRLAGSAPGMWTAIARENSAALSDALWLAERELAGLRGALSRGDDGALHERLAAARAWFDV